MQSNIEKLLDNKKKTQKQLPIILYIMVKRLFFEVRVVTLVLKDSSVLKVFYSNNKISKDMFVTQITDLLIIVITSFQL